MMNQLKVLEHVSSNIKFFREARGLSQQELADKATVSRRTIAGLETDQVNISLVKLEAIATVLGVSFAQLVSPREASNRTNTILAWQGQTPDSHAALHCTAPAKQQVEMWSWQLAPHETYHAEPDPQGWHEMLYIIEGVLTLTLDGQSQTLAAGATISYPSHIDYCYANHEPTPLKFIRTVSY